MSVLLSVGRDTSLCAFQEELVLQGDSAPLQRCTRCSSVMYWNMAVSHLL